METPIPEKEKTVIVQAVVSATVAEDIEAEAQAEDRSISNTIARVLSLHYAKRRLARRPRQQKAA
jgi:hypothetical protein